MQAGRRSVVEPIAGAGTAGAGSYAVRSIMRAIRARASRDVIPRSAVVRVMAHWITTGVRASRSASREILRSAAVRSMARSRVAGGTGAYVMRLDRSFRIKKVLFRPTGGPGGRRRRRLSAGG